MNYRIRAELSIKKIDTTIFILDRANSVLHSFTETGAFLWELLQGGIPATALADRLAAEFDVGIDEANRDVDGFLDTLEEKCLIELNG
jgi:hypothetical protein